MMAKLRLESGSPTAPTIPSGLTGLPPSKFFLLKNLLLT